MRNSLVFLAALFFVYSCTQLSGKETPRDSKSGLMAEAKTTLPPNTWRVGKTEATKMRNRRGSDDAMFKISAEDLKSVLAAGTGANDSVVIYLIRYDFNEKSEKSRYIERAPNTNWKEMKKTPTGILLGLLPGTPSGMYLTKNFYGRQVELWDMAVVCPPPPDCDCDIKEIPNN